MAGTSLYHNGIQIMHTFKCRSCTNTIREFRAPEYKFNVTIKQLNYQTLTRIVIIKMDIIYMCIRLRHFRFEHLGTHLPTVSKVDYVLTIIFCNAHVDV